MMNTDNPCEKMTLFWNNHFAPAAKEGIHFAQTYNIQRKLWRFQNVEKVCLYAEFFK